MEIGYSHSVRETPPGCVNHYPFGLEMPGRVYVSGSAPTREGYTGHELDAETGMNYAGARYYMPALGRWTSTDPLAASYPSLSPYNYVANNPISLIDPDGMRIDNFVFGEDGQYIRTEETDDEEDYVVVESDSGNRESYSLHDPKNDSERIRYLIGKYGSEATLVFQESTNDYAERIYDSGVWGESAQADPMGYARYESGRGGRMDFAPNLQSESISGGMEASDIHIRRRRDVRGGAYFLHEGTAYNIFDYGNNLWGGAMNVLGVGLNTSRRGAHLYTLTTAGQLDSSADQRAITNGWNYVDSNKAVMLGIIDALNN